MSNTNFIVGIVKILETPKQKKTSENILMTRCKVQFPKVQKNFIVCLKIWGTLGDYAVKYYKVNDYILIEGYLALREGMYQTRKRKIEITVSKIFPFLLS